jgi:hypothetical protein
VASRNALEPGSGQQAVPVRATLLGSIAAVTAVISAAVFGASLTGLVSHSVRYGWNWRILIQAEGGYGNFSPGVMNRLVGGQPTVAAWSSFGFSQLTIDGRVVGVPLGVAAGRWAWGGFAGSLGVAPVTVVPALLLAAGCAAVLLAGNLLASVPAAMAARTPAAGTLRTE